MGLLPNLAQQIGAGVQKSIAAQPVATQAPTPQTAPQGEQLDKDAVNLAKAIRQVESGGDFNARGASGEWGAYQFMPKTWAALTAKFLGRDIPFGQGTPADQNEAAYKQIKGWKDAGMNVGEIASSWNAGSHNKNAYTGVMGDGQPASGINSQGVHYDTAGYAKKVAETYQEIKLAGANDDDNGIPVDEQGYATQAAPVPEDSKPVEKKEGLLQGLVKGIVNPFARVVGSAYNAVAAPISLANSLARGRGINASFSDAQQELDKTRHFSSGTDKDGKKVEIDVKPLLLGEPERVGDTYGIKTGLSAAGAAAQIGSNFIGAEGAGGIASNLAKGEIARGAITGGLTGAAAGTLQGLGSGLQQDKLGVASVAKSTLEGTALGGLTGGALGAGSGLLGSLINKATGKIPDTVIGKYFKNNPGLQGVWDMVSPQKAAPGSLLTERGLTGSKVISIPRTVNDFELIDASAPYIVPNDPIATHGRIESGITQTAKELRDGIQGRGGTWSLSNLKGTLNNTDVPLAIKNTAEMTQVHNINDYIGTLATDTEKSAEGALDLAQQFRQSINKEYGENIWNKDTPIASYIRRVNQQLNDFAFKHIPDGTLPDGTPLQDLMKKQSLLYRALENIKLPKVGSGSDNLLGRAINVGKNVGIDALKHVPAGGLIGEIINRH